jgi:uncharacterized membrane protein YeiH
MHQLYFLDLLGSFAFAVYGTYFSARRGFDIFGILVCATISALGGGTIRELLLNRLPGYFSDYNYFLVVILGIVFTLVFYKQFKNERFNFYMLSVDAIGLVTFAYIGASQAAYANLGLLGILMFSVLTAVGGGVIRDVIMGETPHIFYQDFYATPALLFGAGFYLAHDKINNPFVLYGLLIVVFVVRIIAIKKKSQLWKPIKLTNS